MQKLGIVGVGAMGAFIAKHLSPHFDLVLYEPHRDISAVAADYNAKVGSLGETAACDIVVLAVPSKNMAAMIETIAPMVKSGAVIIDIAEQKTGPMQAMKRFLPTGVHYVGTHPLFGPQSGKYGVEGLDLAICKGNNQHALTAVRRFCRDKLKVRVSVTTPEEHDRTTAYVMSLTHLVVKIMTTMDMPPIRFSTRTFDHLRAMMNLIGQDSDELFRAIVCDNPYATEIREKFFSAASMLESKLADQP